MKTYKVQWFQHGSPVKINAGTPHEAYRNFLEQEEETKAFAVVVKWGLLGIKSFSEHLEEERKAQEEERKAHEEQLKRIVLELTERMKAEGFDSLNGLEILHISEIVDHSFSNPDAQSIEETNLVKAAVADSAFYRYLSLRNSSLSAQQQAALLETLGAKLSDISSKAGGIRAGTTFAGLAAAKHLGEEMAEDFGGDE